VLVEPSVRPRFVTTASWRNSSGAAQIISSYVISEMRTEPDDVELELNASTMHGVTVKYSAGLLAPISRTAPLPARLVVDTDVLPKPR